MRVKMRSSLYLSDPEMTSKLKSFSGEELDGKLLDITSFGIETKKQNILKIMRYWRFLYIFAEPENRCFQNRKQNKPKYQWAD